MSGTHQGKNIDRSRAVGIPAQAISRKELRRVNSSSQPEAEKAIPARLP